MIRLDKPLDLRTECPSYDRLVGLLCRLPVGEVYEGDEILSKTGVGMDTFWRHKKRLAPYRHKAGRKVYWGHPKAIEEFKRRLANL